MFPPKLNPITKYERVSSVSNELKTTERESTFDESQESSSSLRELDDDEERTPITPTENDDDYSNHEAGLSASCAIYFGVAGLLNNVPYVIMLACAKNISEGGVAAVYIANSLPGLTVKFSAPYWFDYVTYRYRLLLAASVMFVAFALTAYFTMLEEKYYTIGDDNKNNTKWSVLIGQLFGVALVSFQCGLGEASLLALAGKFDSYNKGSTNDQGKKGKCLTAFSSGTGLAGPMGYLWKIAINEWFGWSVAFTLSIASLILSLSYNFVGKKLVDQHEQLETNCYNIENVTNRVTTADTDNENNEEGEHQHDDNDGLMVEDEDVTTIPVNEMGFRERFHLVSTLCWPYMIPLFIVYAAEYACQSGAWTAIGFPVSSEVSRATFYEQSNWLYQAGVFFSRSSGTLFTVNMIGLWIMPLLQVINLIIFSTTAANGNNNGLLYNKVTLKILCLYTGLLGGGVYVHGYKRIVADVPKVYTEFALASTSVAEGLGVLVADIFGLFIQSCLYRSNNLSGALVNCPL